MDTQIKTKRFITHLVVDEIPSRGLKRVYFYTSTIEGINQGKYFFGTDRNSLNKEYIEDLEKKGQIIPLNTPKELEDKKCLWVDSFGIVHYGNIKDPYDGIEFLASPEQFSKVFQVYNISIGHENVPKTELVVSF